MGAFARIHERRKKQIAKNLVLAAGIWIGQARKLVAIDTGELLSSLKVGRTIYRPGKIAVELGSYGVSYARWVEVGNSNINAYHRNKTIVYIGNGQHFLRRAKAERLGEILATIKQK